MGAHLTVLAEAYFGVCLVYNVLVLALCRRLVRIGAIKIGAEGTLLRLWRLCRALALTLWAMLTLRAPDQATGRLLWVCRALLAVVFVLGFPLWFGPLNLLAS